MDYSSLMHLEKKLQKYQTKKFNIVFRKAAMSRKTHPKVYTQCLGLPFWAYISSKGEVYPCSTFLGLKKYCIGNIHNSSFVDVWEGARRRKVMKSLMKMDARKCRELCRLDEINTYLWKLKNPVDHINFI